MQGKGGAGGVALVEVYELDTTGGSQRVEVSTRGRVRTGDDVMIGGVIVDGDAPANVLMRAIGPELTARGVAGALADPILELHNSEGDLLASNDNWESDEKEKIVATGLPPASPRESATVRLLDPGAYTVIVRGKDETAGVALVEIYVLQER